MLVQEKQKRENNNRWDISKGKAELSKAAATTEIVQGTSMAFPQSEKLQIMINEEKIDAPNKRKIDESQ